ncbi:MAG: hypothetical protein KKH67_09955 [candidate division Zixibacteria bacterium]|nr:hypothetical protein [candidate division Zixibacteria bacterium]MBU1470915.1 hypothetical protein [candidate division Zixibacteria bacterium]
MIVRNLTKFAVLLMLSCTFIIAGSSVSQTAQIGDTDCSGAVDIDDVVFLIAYIFTGGPAPCNPDFSGAVVGNGPCKTSMKTADVDTIPNTQTCIEYTYDGVSTLQVRHLNGGFNCCPVFVAEFSIDGDVITITEIDSLYMGGCDCECLFDIDYELVGVMPGVYTISVVEVITFPGEDPLEFPIDLTTATSGLFCVERLHYPWNL